MQFQNLLNSYKPQKFISRTFSEETNVKLVLFEVNKDCENSYFVW